MSSELVELMNQQSKKLDEHLAHLRKSLNETNHTLQGVISTSQITHQEVIHNNLMTTERLEVIKKSVVLLKKEIDAMDGELRAFNDTVKKVDIMYSAYSILHKVILTAIGAGLLYVTVLVTKAKTGL